MAEVIRKVTGRIAAALTGAAVLAIAACTSTSPPPQAGPADSSASATVRSTTPTSLPARPEEYVAAFVAVWRAGDRASAERLATPGAAESAFALTPTSVSDPACFTDAGATNCEVIDLTDQSSIQMAVDLALVKRRSEHAITRVVDTAGNALPRDPEGYAFALMDAWKAGDRTAALHLGTSDAVTALFNHGDGEGWTHRFTDGAAGTSYPIFDGPDGEVLTLQVSNADVSMQQTQAVHSAAFGSSLP
jgi:hypothetical protein